MGISWYQRNKDYQKQNAKKHRDEYKRIGKEFIWEYLSTHPCISCGETDPYALEFHHVRGKKEIEVSRLVGTGSSLERLKAEIEKCDVLCANCHRKLTAREQGWCKNYVPSVGENESKRA
jgi:ArsR family metal-binding transcriptional regulator